MKNISRFVLAAFDFMEPKLKRGSEGLRTIISARNLASSSNAEIEFLIQHKVLKPFNALNVISEYLGSLGDHQISFKAPPFLVGSSESEVGLFLETFRLALNDALIEEEEKKDLTLNGMSELSQYIDTLHKRAVRRAKLIALTNSMSNAESLFVPIFSEHDFPNDSKRIVRERQVMDLLLRKFPIPDDDVEWERILDFREDSDSKDKLLNLRRWIRQISSSSFNIREIEEELDYLVHEYEKLIGFHKIKHRQKNLELFVTAPLEIIENLAKLNWSKAAKALFQLRQNRVDYLISENTLPGREIAYIHKATEEFAMKR